jgi:Cft2 family RNA processing exonuclease
MKDFFLALGGGNEIGASCYLLHLAGVDILLDAGMRLNADRAFPDFGLLNKQVGGMEFLHAYLLTHAHLDHCGALTRLQYESPHVPKFATTPTIALAEIMLGDALRVSQQHAEDWSVVDACRDLLDEALETFCAVPFRQAWQLGDSGATATAIPAGHILGAASFLIELGGRRILYTGDFCLHAQRTIAGMRTEEVSDVDILVIESTYAYQPQGSNETVEEQYYSLGRLVSGIICRGGRVLIPAFSLGRAQEISATFYDFFEQGLLEPFPILLDGLVKAVCEVYEANRRSLQARLQTRSGHAIYGPHVRPTARDFYPSRRSIDALGPTCIVSSSGMLLDGTRSAAYARVLMEDERSAIVFSGYLDEESPGRRLWNLRESETPWLRLGGKRIDVRCQVEQYHLSAHASSSDLRRLIELVHPRQVILVHRDDCYDGDAGFVDFMLRMERAGTRFHLCANGVPIYL